MYESVHKRARQWIERLSNIRMLKLTVNMVLHLFASHSWTHVNTKTTNTNGGNHALMDNQVKKSRGKNRNFQKMFPWKCYISVKLCSVWFESFFNMSFCSFSVKLFYFCCCCLFRLEFWSIQAYISPFVVGWMIKCWNFDENTIDLNEHIEYATDSSWTQYMWRLILPSPISAFTMTDVLRILSWPDFVMTTNNQLRAALTFQCIALFII